MCIPYNIWCTAVSIEKILAIGLIQWLRYLLQRQYYYKGSQLKYSSRYNNNFFHVEYSKKQIYTNK